MRLGFNGATTQTSDLVADIVNDVENIPWPEITGGHRLYPGDGVILLPAIGCAGFDGLVSVEPCRQTFGRHDPRAVAREARAKTEAVWAAAGRNA